MTVVSKWKNSNNNSINNYCWYYYNNKYNSSNNNNKSNSNKSNDQNYNDNSNDNDTSSSAAAAETRTIKTRTMKTRTIKTRTIKTRWRLRRRSPMTQQRPADRRHLTTSADSSAQRRPDVPISIHTAMTTQAAPYRSPRQVLQCPRPRVCWLDARDAVMMRVMDKPGDGQTGWWTKQKCAERLAGNLGVKDNVMIPVCVRAGDVVKFRNPLPGTPLLFPISLYGDFVVCLVGLFMDEFVPYVVCTCLHSLLTEVLRVVSIL